MNGLIGIFGKNITQEDQEAFLKMQEIFVSDRNSSTQVYRYDNLLLTINSVNAPKYVPVYKNDIPGKVKIHIDGTIYNIDENFNNYSIEELYQNFGADYPDKLNGIFNSIILDEEKELLHISKDHLGQKSLYYFINNNKIIFSSSLAILKRHKNFPKEISYNAVSDYLSFLYVPGNTTIYKNVKVVNPGTTKTFSCSCTEEKDTKYWQPNYSSKLNISYKDACTKFTSILDEACKRRVKNLDNLAFFLSGGIDSTLIASATCALHKNLPCSAFTVGFNNPAYDEREWARSAAKFIKEKYNKNFTLFEEDLPVPTIDALINAQKLIGQPYADASLLACLSLSIFSSKYNSVILGGDGADEFFASYERYIAISLANTWSFLPDKVKKSFFNLLSSMLPDSGERSKFGRLRRLFNLFANPSYFNLIDRCNNELKDSLFGDNLKASLTNKSEDFLNSFNDILTSKNTIERLSELDIHTYLTGDIFTKSGTSCTSSNIEVRSPFLDKDVVNFLTTLPLEYKLKGFKRKRLLVDTYKDYLPIEIIKRPKKGFGVPIADFLRNNWQKDAQEILFGGTLTKDALFKEKGLLKIWNDHQCGNRDYSYQLYSLLNLSIFLENNQ